MSKTEDRKISEPKARGKPTGIAKTVKTVRAVSRAVTTVGKVAATAYIVVNAVKLVQNPIGVISTIFGFSPKPITSMSYNSKRFEVLKNPNELQYEKIPSGGIVPKLYSPPDHTPPDVNIYVPKPRQGISGAGGNNQSWQNLEDR